MPLKRKKRKEFSLELRHFYNKKKTKWLQGFNEPTRAFLTHTWQTSIPRQHRALLLHSNNQHVSFSFSFSKNKKICALLTCCCWWCCDAIIRFVKCVCFYFTAQQLVIHDFYTRHTGKSKEYRGSFFNGGLSSCAFSDIFLLLFIGAHQQNHTHVMHNKMARKLFCFFFLIAQQRQCQSITQKFQLSFVYQTQTKISTKKKIVNSCRVVCRRPRQIRD